MSTDTLDPLFTALRELRRAAGQPTIRVLARKAGRPKSTVDNALRGDILSSWSVIHDIVAALHGDTDHYLALYEQAAARPRKRAGLHSSHAYQAAPRKPKTTTAGCDRCGCLIADAVVHAGACNGAPRLPQITVSMAPLIDEDSWLNEDRFAEFREAYAYASGCTNAIPGLAKLDPEEAYYVWWFLQRGIEKARGESRREDV